VRETAPTVIETDAFGPIFLWKMPAFWLVFLQAFSAGAILTTLANSMMPEAFEQGGKLAVLVTVIGFATSVVVMLLERAKQGV
jgi:zinc transporter ZupT